jgi:hypothetical protein
LQEKRKQRKEWMGAKLLELHLLMQESTLLTVCFVLMMRKTAIQPILMRRKIHNSLQKHLLTLLLYIQAQLKNAIADMLAVKSRAELEKVWYANPAMQNDKEFVNACMEMGKIYPAS